MVPPSPAEAGQGQGQVQGQQRQPQQQQEAGGLGQSLTGIIRIAVLWYFASKFFFPKKTSDPANLISNIFQRGEPLDMWLYLSESEKFNDFGNEQALVWHETNIPYAVWGPEGTRSVTLKYYPSEALKHNGSLNAHVFFARSGYSADPNDPEYQHLSAFGRTHPIVKYFPKSKADKRKSLLGDSKGSDEAERMIEAADDTDDDSKDDGHVDWVPYWKPNITINLVDDFTRYPHNGVPPNVAPCILGTLHFLPFQFETCSLIR